TRPSAGRITVRGRISSLLEVGAGFHHDLNGRENIFLAGAILGMNRRAVQCKLDEMIDFAGLASFIDAPVRSYSSGMLLRLAFSVGIHLDSDILVIDEALAVGDQNFKIRCVEKISQFQCNGGTLVLVSHDDVQLRAICKYGLLLSAGKVVFGGDIDIALAQYHSPQSAPLVFNKD
ncbi:MAG: sugar ABC transporter ATP-binding protein, partial [Acinetobacter sp.]